MRPFLLLATMLATALTSVTIASPAPDIPRTASLVQGAPRGPPARVRCAPGRRSRCASSSAPARSRTARARTTIRASCKEWVPLLNERGAKATGAEAFPTKAQLDQTDVLILHSQAAGNITDATDRKNLERLPRARRRARRHSRRRGLGRSRLVQGHHRRLVAQRHHEVARRADAPLLHRPRQPDHEGRVELGDGRRDLLRHGHAAGGPDPGRRPTRRSRPARATPRPRSAPRSSPAAANG